MELCQEELKRVLSYCKDTGIFVSNSSGKQVGYISTKGKNSYVRVKVFEKNYAAHRLAWLYEYGSMPEKPYLIDHIDRNGTNNKISNLRLATNKQNQENRGLGSNNTSGFLGVSWHKQKSMWQAKIKHNGIRIWIGLFDSASEASVAYELKAKELFTHAIFGN